MAEKLERFPTEGNRVPPASRKSGRWSREQQQVAVGIAHDEIPRTPRLLLERLMEVDARRLVLQEELADLGGAVDRHGRRQQALALADVAHEHRLAEHAQVEPHLVAPDLGVERRLAIGVVAVSGMACTPETSACQLSKPLCRAI